MTSISITIQGDKETIQRLRKLGSKLMMFNQAMKAIGNDLEDYYGGKAFASQGGVYGEKWPALSAAYKNVKATGHASLDRSKWRKKRTIAKIYPGAGVLIATGKMKNNFTSSSTSTSVTVTNNSKQFKYHQSTAARTTKLPRRKMMGVNNEIRTMIAKTIDLDIKQKLRTL